MTALEWIALFVAALLVHGFASPRFRVWKMRRARARRSLAERSADASEAVEEAIPGFLAAYEKQQRKDGSQ